MPFYEGREVSSLAGVLCSESAVKEEKTTEAKTV